MKDRVSKYPGRVKLIPVEGQENVYDLRRADEPEEEGTPLNAATFLRDATAELAGLSRMGSEATPDDVFNVLLKRLTAGTEDLTAGESDLPDGVDYLVYKEDA